MSTQKPFADLDIHQKLMDELQKGADAVMKAAGQVDEALKDLDNHNNDITAHPDMRKAISELQNNVSGSFDEMIANHNASESAHPALVAKLEKALAESSNVEKLINSRIDIHNNSDTAHSDIRASLDMLEIQIGETDLTELTERVAKLESDDVELHEAVIKLQSKDAEHDNLIAANHTGLQDINDTLAIMEEDIRAVASTDVIQGSADKNTIQQTITDVVQKLGLKSYDPDGPSLINFACDLPTYIGKGASAKFHLTGAESVNPNNNPIEYSIQQGKGDYTISVPDHISEGQELTMTVGNNVSAGDTLYFAVTATDMVKNTSVATAVAVMVARPVEVTRVSLTGLPGRVEPGSSYNINVRNMADDGTRYSYGLDPKSSGIIFSPPSDIKISDNIAMTIPTSAPRDSDLTFDLYIYDSYSDTQSRAFTIHTNAIPGAEDFVCNVPNSVVPGQSLYIHFSGIRGSDGSSSTYDIESNNNFLTFSKTEGILANENVKLDIAQDIPRGETYEFDVIAITKDGSKVIIPVSVLVNTPPESSAITTTLPPTTRGGTSLEMYISGGTDAEGSPVTYNIDAAGSGFSFSHVTGVGPNTPVVVKVPHVAEDVYRTFQVYAVDSYGEKSTTAKEITIQVTPVYVADTPYIISPKEDDKVFVDFTMTWSEFTKHVKMA